MWMTYGEAKWILWGLAIQNGLCPDCAKPLDKFPDTSVDGWGVRHPGRCPACNKEWYLDPDSGQCIGWWARGLREVQQP